MSGRDESVSRVEVAQVARVATPTEHSVARPLLQDSANFDANRLATNGTTPLPVRSSPGPAPQPPSGKPPAIPNGNGSAFPPAGQTSPSSQPHSVITRDPKAAAAAASDPRNIVRRKLTGFVGFANLPNQWHRKSVRKGFNFNVMVVGE